MSQNAVPHAVRQEKQREVVQEDMAGEDVKCTRLSVLSVVRTPKYLLNHVPEKQSIVVIATAKSEDNLQA